MSENNQINKAPALSMLDVVRAATRTCDSKANCRLNCDYYHFCESLKRSYYEVQRACDDNQELKSFIEHAYKVERGNNNG